MMGTTEKTVEKTGDWETLDKCHFRTRFDKGDTFPPCPDCGEPREWVLVKEDAQWMSIKSLR